MQNYLKLILKNACVNYGKNYRAVCDQSELVMGLETHYSSSTTWFIKCKSTLTNLILYQNYIIKSVKSKEQVDIIYTDLSLNLLNMNFL